MMTFSEGKQDCLEDLTMHKGGCQDRESSIHWGEQEMMDQFCCGEDVYDPLQVYANFECTRDDQ